MTMRKMMMRRVIIERNKRRTRLLNELSIARVMIFQLDSARFLDDPK